LHTIEQKFHLLRLTEGLKAEYATHQLQGPARIWWCHYRSSLLADVEVTWEQFRIAFRGHYIPPGLMAMKHTEFMPLTQGNKTLNEYLQSFNNLSRYATEFVDTDAKKIASFKRGLSSKLIKTMGNSKCTTFNEFISDVITQDNNNSIHVASKSRKRVFEAGASQSKAHVASKMPYHAPVANVRYRPPVNKNLAKTGFRKGYTIALPKTTPGQGSSNALPSNCMCWNYNKTRHWAKECPYPSKKTNQGHVCQGHAHFTTVEEIPTGKFLLNKCPAVVLFDSGASHSFISLDFTSRCGMTVSVLEKDGFCISAASNNVSTNQVVFNASVEIEGRTYGVDLVVLPGLELDVILRMQWMKGNEVLIDTST
jgi:hypothetical protein